MNMVETSSDISRNCTIVYMKIRARADHVNEIDVFMHCCINRTLGLNVKIGVLPAGYAQVFAGPNNVHFYPPPP